MTDMPPTIRVGAYLYRVEQLDIGDSGHDGLQNDSTLRIVVNTDLAPLYERGVLLHEVVHACLSHGAQFLDHDQGEMVAAALESALLGVLRDNPELVKYLTEEV